jgi:hypothetical protein
MFVSRPIIATAPRDDCQSREAESRLHVDEATNRPNPCDVRIARRRAGNQNSALSGCVSFALISFVPTQHRWSGVQADWYRSFAEAVQQ